VTQTRPRLRAYTVVGLSGIGRIPYEETRTNFRPRVSGWSHHISQTDVNPIRRLLPLTTPVLPLNGMPVISTRMQTSTSRFFIPVPITSSKTTRTRPEVAADVILGPRLELATAPAHLDVGRGPPGAICWSPLDHWTGRTVQTEVGSAWPSIRVHDEPVVVCGHPSQVTVVVINKCGSARAHSGTSPAGSAGTKTHCHSCTAGPSYNGNRRSRDPCFAVGRHVQGSSGGRRGLGSDASGHHSLQREQVGVIPRFSGLIPRLCHSVMEVPGCTSPVVRGPERTAA
jgi:hypothetical protein